MKLGNQEYKMAFTMAAMIEIEDQHGEIDQFEKIFEGKGKLKKIVWLVTLGINSWISREKELDPAFDVKKVTEDRVAALIDFSQPKKLVQELKDAFTLSMRPSIEVEDDDVPDPNAGTA